jgi:hypothetical protein
MNSWLTTYTITVELPRNDPRDENVLEPLVEGLDDAVEPLLDAIAARINEMDTTLLVRKAMGH